MRPIGGAEIGGCLTKIHHDRYTSGDRTVDEARSRDIARGLAHEERVIRLIEHAHGTVARIQGHDRLGATRAAMSAGAPVIIGARLRSADGTIAGAPDLLLALGDGYAPIEVKGHLVEGAQGPEAFTAPIDDLDSVAGTPVRFRGNRRRDLLQVAHYRRLLEDAGFAASAERGGVIGADEPLRCLWVDLTQGEPSLLDVYDDALAAALRAVTHGAADPRHPLVEPAWRSQCRSCDWVGICKPELEQRDDVTLLSSIHDGIRHTLALDGITTVADIAGLDPDDERLPSSTTVLQARARTAGSLLRFDDVPVTVPAATREIDFDIETFDGRLYLSGFLVTEAGASRYDPIADWTGTPEGERTVLTQTFERLAAYGREGSLVLHWTDYEPYTLQAAADRHGISFPGYDTVASWFKEHALDLCDWARHNLVSPNGYSLKVIAPLAGFTWRDDDPGGRQSEIWFERLLAGDVAMGERLLAYNEDDVIAQLAIRRWLRNRDTGAGPGSGLPPASRWPVTDGSQAG